VIAHGFAKFTRDNAVCAITARNILKGNELYEDKDARQD
jgi:hypothetical protein